MSDRDCYEDKAKGEWKSIPMPMRLCPKCGRALRKEGDYYVCPECILSWVRKDSGHAYLSELKYKMTMKEGMTRLYMFTAENHPWLEGTTVVFDILDVCGVGMRFALTAEECATLATNMDAVAKELKSKKNIKEGYEGWRNRATYDLHHSMTLYGFAMESIMDVFDDCAKDGVTYESARDMAVDTLVNAVSDLYDREFGSIEHLDAVAHLLFAVHPDDLDIDYDAIIKDLVTEETYYEDHCSNDDDDDGGEDDE